MGLFTDEYTNDYYTTVVSPIFPKRKNNELATLVAKAIASNTSIGSYINSQVRNGSGANLIQYYHYAVTRFKNRNYSTKVQNMSLSTRYSDAINQEKLNKLFDSDRAYRHKLINTYNDWDYGNAYYYEFMDRVLNINLFNSKNRTFNAYTYLGMEDTSTGDRSSRYRLKSKTETVKGDILLDKQYIRKVNNNSMQIAMLKTYDGLNVPIFIVNRIGLNDTKYESLAITITTDTFFNSKINKGVTYITNSQKGKLVNNTDNVVILSKTEAKKLGYPIENVGDSLNKEKSDYPDINYRITNDGNDSTTIITGNTNETVIYEDITLTSVDNDTFTYNISTYTYQYTFDKENHAYVLEDQSTNLPGLNKYIFKELTTKTVISNINNIYNFYPYLPLREWFTIAKVNDVFKYSTEVPIDIYNLDNTNLVDIVKNSNEEKEKRDKEKITIGKIEQSKEALEYNKEKKLHHKIKIDSHDLYPNKSSTNASTKKHITFLASLLGVEPVDIMANLKASKDWDSYRKALISVTPSLDINDVNVAHYWFNFWNRTYKNVGEDNNILTFLSNLRKAKDINNIPVTFINTTNATNKHSCGISYAFINKFKIKGKLRKVNGRHAHYEILRGQPKYIKSKEDLIDNLYPPSSRLPDEYYMDSDKTEYNIGTLTNHYPVRDDNIHPIKAYEGYSSKTAFYYHNYTMFARYIGNGTLEVIAVAGLQGYSNIIQNSREDISTWGNAWFDIDLQTRRNKDYYLNGKTDSQHFYARDNDNYNRKYVHIHNFFNLPLDFNTFRLLPVIARNELAKKCVYMDIYTYHTQEYETLAGWIGWVAVVPQLVAIGFAIIDGGVTAALIAITKSALIAAISYIVIDKLIVPLLESLGVDALAIAIVTTVLNIVTMLITGSINSGNLIYASGAVINNIASNAFKYTETINQQNQIARNEDINNFNEVNKDLINKMREYENSLPKYDASEVLNASRFKAKLIDPSIYISGILNVSNSLASPEYLNIFLEHKLSLDLDIFDSIASVNFNFPKE